MAMLVISRGYPSCWSKPRSYQVNHPLLQGPWPPRCELLSQLVPAKKGVIFGIWMQHIRHIGKHWEHIGEMGNQKDEVGIPFFTSLSWTRLASRTAGRLLGTRTAQNETMRVWDNPLPGELRRIVNILIHLCHHLIVTKVLISSMAFNNQATVSGRRLTQMTVHLRGIQRAWSWRNKWSH